MTTIAYRDGVLAADGRATNNGWIGSDSIAKVARLSDGRLFGFCGELETQGPFDDWLRSNDGVTPHPDLGDSRAIVVARNGVVTVYEGKGHFLVSQRFLAYGSGMPVALGAMHVGADAIAAVRAACKVDTHSGGRVRWVALSGGSRKKR